MNPATLRRIKKELDDLKKHPPIDMSLGPVNDNDLTKWEGILNGPDKSPYANGIFKFTVDFTNDYPMKPPIVRFTTKMFHPNISERGDICVDILKNNWSSVYDISKVMISIASLLNDPNPDSAYNGEAAKLYKEDKPLYNTKVKEYVKKYASAENL